MNVNNNLKAFQLGVSVLILMAAGCSVGLDFPIGGDPLSFCEVNGETFAHGTEGIPAPDSCKICVCDDGELFCTKRCPGSCIAEDGTVYPDGARVPSADSCNTCGCSDGDIFCTTMACPEFADCVFEGDMRVPHGTSVRASDGCNTCTCNDGEMACTEMGCVPNPPMEGCCARAARPEIRCNEKQNENACRVDSACEWLAGGFCVARGGHEGFQCCSDGSWQLYQDDDFYGCADFGGGVGETCQTGSACTEMGCPNIELAAELTRVSHCGFVMIDARNDDNTVWLNLSFPGADDQRVNSEQTYTFDLPSDQVNLEVRTGERLTINHCTDVSYSPGDPQGPLVDARYRPVSGRVSIVLYRDTPEDVWFSPTWQLDNGTVRITLEDVVFTYGTQTLSLDHFDTGEISVRDIIHG